MGTRAEVAEHIKCALEDADSPAKVVSFVDGTAPEPSKPVVVVGLKAVTPGEYLTRRAATVEILCAVANQTPGPADDELEDLLGQVLDALDTFAWANWITAERATYLEAFPAFAITVEI